MESDSPTVPPEDLATCSDISSAIVHRDDMFYFTLVTFKVEDCLFRVLKHKLEEHSHVFRNMFSMPTPNDGTVAEGTSDENPICLDMVAKEDFKLLLKFLYMPMMTDTEVPLTLGQCTAIFDLTRMWGFDNVRRIAKDRIRTTLWPTIPSVDKITLALEYEVEDWYFDAYYETVIREEPLSVEEMQKLGFNLAAKIAKVREKVARAPTHSSGFGTGAPSVTREPIAREGVSQHLMPVPISFTSSKGKKKKGRRH
ncbi:hypothetical protein ACEPAF_7506 [Sanghuangporus sanghuang]